MHLGVLEFVKLSDVSLRVVSCNWSWSFQVLLLIYEWFRGSRTFRYALPVFLSRPFLGRLLQSIRCSRLTVLLHYYLLLEVRIVLEEVLKNLVFDLLGNILTFNVGLQGWDRFLNIFDYLVVHCVRVQSLFLSWLFLVLLNGYLFISVGWSQKGINSWTFGPIVNLWGQLILLLLLLLKRQLVLMQIRCGLLVERPPLRFIGKLFVVLSYHQLILFVLCGRSLWFIMDAFALI